MGRMKDKFIEEQEKQSLVNTIEWNLNNEPIENSSNINAKEYDAWWDSLTDDQKEELFKDRDASEREMTDEDFFGPNKTWGI